MALFGLAATSTLAVLRVRGALLWGIVITTVASAIFGLSGGGPGETALEGPLLRQFVGLPSGLSTTFLAFDISEVLSYGLVTVILTFTFVDLFDTTGTLVGVASKTGLLDESGRLPKARGALLADALATMAGAAFGTSTTTTYVESAAGVAEGGRTGLTSFTAGLLFLLALFFAPLVAWVPVVATAPVLIIVGVFMMEPVTRIDFADFRDSIPVFLTIAVMPLAFSISEGIVAGILAYTFLRAVSGRARQLSPTLWILSVLFVIRLFVT